jgi:glycosyltransferase involved in cell wall biosynthesis
MLRGNMIKFSVLMTVYEKDNPVFFKLALESITDKQLLKPNQVVLVCDGMLTDELDKVILESAALASGRLHVIRLKYNVGQGNALNIGLKQCLNVYVARMDSDDISMPERFLKQISFIKNNPSIDIVSSTILEFNEHSFLGSRVLPADHAGIIRMMKFRSPVNHGCCVYNKNKVLAVKGYSDLYQCQDYLLWIKLAKSGAKFANIKESHLHVRMNEGFSKKIGLAYSKEELKIQVSLYKFGFNNEFEFILNFFVKVIGRLGPEKAVSFFYNKYFRD